MSEQKDEGAQQAANPAEVPAALTAGEWEVGIARFRSARVLTGTMRLDGHNMAAFTERVGDAQYLVLQRPEFSEEEVVVLRGRERHALAALCLDGHPFGFTHDDLKLLRESVECCGADRCVTSAEHAAVEAVDRRLASIRARIAALLPPAETEER